MTDSAKERSAPTRSRPRRAPRFVLPDVHHDERTADRIVAFLDGRAASSRPASSTRAEGRKPRRPKELDTRPDWTAAFLHEASRHDRYGRPASVLLLELARGQDGTSVDRVARALGDLIRTDVRETDRAVRIGPSSFRLLMPETNARAARHVGVRLERAFQLAHGGRTDRPDLRLGVAAPTRGGSLNDALAKAERRLEG